MRLVGLSFSCRPYSTLFHASDVVSIEKWHHFTEPTPYAKSVAPWGRTMLWKQPCYAVERSEEARRDAEKGGPKAPSSI